jgi:hypothetical protein
MPFSRPFSFGQMKINMGTLLTPSLTLSSKRVPLLCCIALRRTQRWRVFRTVAMGNPSCLKLSRFALPNHEDTPVTWDACFFPVQYCSPDVGRDVRGSEALGHEVRWRCQISSVRHGFKSLMPSAVHREFQEQYCLFHGVNDEDGCIIKQQVKVTP